ncbi:MAG: aminotransferase class I/II-fold pyridoxal phosphate-dependent enzyme [Sphingobacteriales bacterium]|nr:aminotransferase class I/II-fold pyridoxal phosphate-dependent enzyme [Sphingobacteriales bacterium]
MDRLVIRAGKRQTQEQEKISPSFLKPNKLTIVSKLPDISTNIFTVMSALATEHKAVNLGQGFPDFPMNQDLIGLVEKSMRSGYNQYSPMQGYLPLREVLSKKIHSLYGTSVSPDSQITVTPGGTYGIYTSLTALLRPGDEVIIFEPAYDSYIPNVVVNGATPVLINLQFPEYKIDWEEVKRKITPRTKLIMLNSPHNPTGSILKEEDINQLRSLVAGTGIYILSDEVYEHLIYDNAPHCSMLRYPDLFERSFVCFSFGKIYHCTGWKLGYVVSSPSLMKEFRKLHQFNCFACHTPSQVALSSFLENKEAYLGLGSFMQQKRDYFISLMKDTKFDLLDSKGSYFICATYNRISDEKDSDFAIRITKEFGVATIPVSAFYQAGTDNKVIRFCFAKKEDTLEKAVEKLRKIG